MPVKNTLQNSITEVLYTFGSIYRFQLQELLKFYSLSPERFIQNLKSKNVFEFDNNTKIISLNPQEIKKYSKILKQKPNLKLIDSHDFITAQALLYYLENQDLKINHYQIEKRIDGTALQADLYLSLKNGFDVYFEADTGTERIAELRNKILNYENIDETKTVVIFVTTSDINYQNLLELTQDKSMFKICLNMNINKILEEIEYSYKPTQDTKVNNIQTDFNLNNTVNNVNDTNLTLREIQKLITSL